jgi:AsmA protein
MNPKTKKYLILAAGLLAVLVVAFVVLAKVLITPERIKQVLLPRVEKTLQRPVALGEVDFSLFSGILLNDLVIREKTGDEIFISADQVALRYQFWPLLKKRVVIDRIILEKPQIRIERFSDGTFNFDDLMAKSAQDQDEAAEPQETQPPKAGRGIDLLVSTVTLRGGAVSILDHKVPIGPPFSYQLKDLVLEVDDLSLERDFPVRLEASLGRAPLVCSGRIDPAAKTLQARLVMNGFDVVPFAPYFGEKFPGRLDSLKIDLELTLAGDAERLVSEGRIGLRDIGLQLKALGDKPLKNSTLDLEYGMQLDRPASSVTLEKGLLVFNGQPVSLAGKVTEFSKKPLLDLTVNLSDLDLKKAVAALPAGFSPGLGKLEPAGKMDARLHLAGAVSDPKKLLQDGEIRLTGVQALVGGLRPALSGLINLKQDSLSAKGLDLVVGDNRAHIDLQAQGLTAKPIVVTAALTSERFLLDPLLKGGTSPAAAGGESPAKQDKPAMKEEIGPFNLPLKLTGTAAIGETLYKGMAIEQFKARYRLENNMLIVEEMTGKVAGGTFKNTARVDLGRKGLDYEVKITTRGVQANPLVTAFLPKAANTVFGGLNFQIDMAGQGTRTEAIRRNLTANGDMLLKDGKLTGAGLASGLAGFLNLEELRELTFQQADGRFAVKNGKVDLTTALTGSKVRLAPQGTVGLDGALDLSLGLGLSPELTAKLGRSGKFTSLLTDSEGWGRLPLKVGGTALKPQFAVDSRALKGMVEEKAKGKLQQLLKEKVLDKQKQEQKQEGSTDQAPQEETQEAPEKILEGVFKGLFGN